MKNVKKDKGQIPFHPGKPELKDNKERGLKDETQNRLKNVEKDGRQVEKKDNAKNAIVGESEGRKKDEKRKI